MYNQGKQRRRRGIPFFCVARCHLGRFFCGEMCRISYQLFARKSSFFNKCHPRVPVSDLLQRGLCSSEIIFWPVLFFTAVLSSKMRQMRVNPGICRLFLHHIRQKEARWCVICTSRFSSLNTSYQLPPFSCSNRVQILIYMGFSRSHLEIRVACPELSTA